MPKLEPFLKKGRLEAGCDEAGRGCLAGPVVAAAVILEKDIPELNDSKQLSEQERNHLRPLIEDQARAWAVNFVGPEEIDEVNILNASFLAMHRAIEQLDPYPEFLLIDGNRFNPVEGLAHECIIKGDGKFLSIAAASVLAKTHRDAYMEALGEKFPAYSWKSNKGYPTPPHKRAIQEHGITPYHRRSFSMSSEQMKIRF